MDLDGFSVESLSTILKSEHILWPLKIILSPYFAPNPFHRIHYQI